MVVQQLLGDLANGLSLWSFPCQAELGHARVLLSALCQSLHSGQRAPPGLARQLMHHQETSLPWCLMLCAPSMRCQKAGTDHRPLHLVQGKGMYHNDITPDNLVMLYDAPVRPWQFSIIDLGAFSLEETVPPQYRVHSCWCNQHILGSCNEHCRLSSSEQRSHGSLTSPMLSGLPAGCRLHASGKGPATRGTQRCCTALQEVPSLVKLAFASDDILRTGWPRRLSDVQSLLFSCVAVSGMELPWTEAANAYDSQKVRELRHLVLKEGASAPLLGRLSPLLRGFAGEYLPNDEPQMGWC